MGFKWMVILLLEITFAGVIYKVVEGDSISRQMVVDVERKTKLHKRDAVKSIQSEDGDIIDCIDIYKQPAFDHPCSKTSHNSDDPEL
ncbi:hypothetical protein F0562_006950 [Nyssa sinensis]|uniref:Neprosin activation peptide domain-containing protein n=1 Tax=Nyssa sinensis TaxID=561372 RepID=A0A5J5A581_9ASTE|nr:hypothetical protein F0562_006950 [Nyssa sinensis]